MTIYQEQAGIRHYPISQRLARVLDASAAAAGIDGVHIFSGGQPSSGTGRTGSHRHDLGDAGDLSLSIRGRQLSENNPTDLPIIQRFFAAAKQNGATGFGAGAGYMGAGRYHVGFGTPAVWGPGETSRNAPAWLLQAVGGGSTADTLASAVNAGQLQTVGGGDQRARFLHTLRMAESNDRNVPNITDPGPGPGGGYFQIKDATWNIYGKQAGIDLAKYPNALRAPPEVQQQVAEKIPLNQWGGRTQRLWREAGFTPDTKLTLGAYLASLGGARTLSPQTANLGPAPAGTSYGKDVTGSPFAGTTAQAMTGAVPTVEAGGQIDMSGLASLFGGSGSDGGGGAYGGSAPSAPPPAITDPQVPPPGIDPALRAQPWDTLAGQPLPRLGQIFDEATIGQAGPKSKALRSQIYGSSWI